MSTYLGWTVVPMPSAPAAPASIEFSVFDPVAISKSPFTGQQQVQRWGFSWMEASVSMPPLTKAQAQAWVQWLRDLNGMANVFQFGTAFDVAYNESVKSKYWRLKSNTRKWSISEARMYGIQFDIQEAL